jgi:predicted metal-dependent hydrolase
MALLMLFFGFFIIFSHKIMGHDYFEDSWLIKGEMKWIIGILFFIYGVFRFYRGIQLDKNEKFRNRE